MKTYRYTTAQGTKIEVTWTTDGLLVTENGVAFTGLTDVLQAGEEPKTKARKK